MSTAASVTPSYPSLRQQQISSSTALGRIEIATNGSVRSLNDSARLHLGLGTSADAQSCLTKLHEFSASLGEELRSGFVREQDFRERVQVDHEERDLRFIVCPINDAQTSLLALIFVEDITNQVAFEENIFRLTQLAGLGVMTAEITHELNNPLMVVRGRAQQIRSLAQTISSPQAPELNRLSDLVCNATDRIVKMVKAIKSLSFGGSFGEFESVPVNDLADEVADLCKNRCVKFDAELRFQGNSGFFIRCQPRLIVQMLTNLASNAIEAVANREARWVEISFSFSDQDAFITITDSGPGIPAELRENIMKPFFSTKSKDTNSGLGLNLARNIVLAHGGSLGIDPDCPNTRFVVKLPRAANTGSIPNAS